MNRNNCVSINDNILMQRVRIMFRNMVETVAWLHKHEICHLDLSLENALITYDNSNNSNSSSNSGGPCNDNDNDPIPLIKIIDFGLAKDFSKIDKTNDKQWMSKMWKNNQRIGKPGYMAPEVYMKFNYDCRAADIWCLGVVLFMVCLMSLYHFCAVNCLVLCCVVLFF